MRRIDAHQHFWRYNPMRDHWIDTTMAVIRKDFLPHDLAPLLTQHGFEGCVVVQSDQSLTENDFQLFHAMQHDFIKGVVGWVDLESKWVEEQLFHYKQYDKMKGFRHVLQGEHQRDFMLRPDFKRGIGLLGKYGFTYDLLVLPDQLPFTSELVSFFPDQLFVVDHMAKPSIKHGTIYQWRKDVALLAQNENVFCKISGMITEADWKEWKASDFIPWLDVVVECFGTKRILFGSDWPVCLVAGSYEAMLSVVGDYFSSFSEKEQELFYGANAINFYKL